MDSQWSFLATLITALAGGGGLSAIIISLLTRKKLMAEAKVKNSESAGIIEEAASSLVEQYRKDNINIRNQYDELEINMKECVKEIKELKTKLNTFETRHTKLLEVIERLVHQVKSLNHTPVCGPEILVGNGE